MSKTLFIGDKFYIMIMKPHFSSMGTVLCNVSEVKSQSFPLVEMGTKILKMKLVLPFSIQSSVCRGGFSGRGRGRGYWGCSSPMGVVIL